MSIFRNKRWLYILILLISVAGLFVSVPCTAQTRPTIHGYVLDSTMYSPIDNATVLNTNTNRAVRTNKKGIFSLPVGVNDVLYITADKYHFDTLRYNILMRDTVIIYMSTLAHMLPSVTVTAKGYTKYQLDSLKRRDEFLTAAGGTEKPVISKATGEGAGFGINLDLISKKERNKRKAFRQFNDHEREMYVAYRFSPELVNSYTGLNGDTLTNFMRLYTPSYEWLRAHTAEEDIFYYLNDKLKLFYKRPK